MKQIIHIDRTTIVKNKDVGSTVSHIPGRKEILFKADKLPNDFIDGDNCIVTEWSESSEGRCNIKGIIIDSDLISEMRNDLTMLSFGQDLNRIEHFPIPPYSFDYVNELLICDECGKKFHYSELESEEYWDGEEEYWIEDICPHCNEGHCVDLEYEKIEDVV